MVFNYIWSIFSNYQYSWNFLRTLFSWYLWNFFFYLYTYYLPGDENLIVEHNTDVSEEFATPSANWNFYPNPSDGSLYWSSFHPLAGNQFVNLYDNVGRKVFSEYWKVQGGINQGQLDLEYLPNGLYHLQIEDITSGEKQLHRLVID